MLKMTSASPYGSAAHWPTMVAMEKDFYREEGIDHELISKKTTGHDITIDILENKVTPVMKSGSDPVLYWTVNGKDYIVVADVLSFVPAQLIARPGIQSVEDLRGKRLAVIDARFGSTLFVRNLLCQHGLKNGDYELQVTGETPLRYRALQNGEVDAAVFVYPFSLQAQADGYKVLSDFVKVYPDTPYSSVLVVGEYARQNPDLMVRFLRATVRSHRWLNDPANREEAVKILQKTSNLAKPLCEQSYDLLVQQLKVYPENCEINRDGQQRMLEMLGRVGELKEPVPQVDAYLDNSYLNEALSK